MLPGNVHSEHNDQVIFFDLEKSLISCKFKNDFFNICKIACLNL